MPQSYFGLPNCARILRSLGYSGYKPGSPQSYPVYAGITLPTCSA